MAEAISTDVTWTLVDRASSGESGWRRTVVLDHEVIPAKAMPQVQPCADVFGMAVQGPDTTLQRQPPKPSQRQSSGTRRLRPRLRGDPSCHLREGPRAPGLRGTGQRLQPVASTNAPRCQARQENVLPQAAAAVQQGETDPANSFVTSLLTQALQGNTDDNLFDNGLCELDVSQDFEEEEEPDDDPRASQEVNDEAFDLFMVSPCRAKGTEVCMGELENSAWNVSHKEELGECASSFVQTVLFDVLGKHADDDLVIDVEDDEEAAQENIAPEVAVVPRDHLAELRIIPRDQLAELRIIPRDELAKVSSASGEQLAEAAASKPSLDIHVLPPFANLDHIDRGDFYYEEVLSLDSDDDWEEEACAEKANCYISAAMKVVQGALKDAEEEVREQTTEDADGQEVVLDNSSPEEWVFDYVSNVLDVGINMAAMAPGEASGARESEETAAEVVNAEQTAPTGLEAPVAQVQECLPAPSSFDLSVPEVDRSSSAATPFACDKSAAVPPRPTAAKGPQRRPVRRTAPAATASAEAVATPTGDDSVNQEAALREKARVALEAALQGHSEVLALKEKARSALASWLEQHNEENALREDARAALEEAVLERKASGMLRQELALAHEENKEFEARLSKLKELKGADIREKAAEALELALLNNSEEEDAAHEEEDAALRLRARSAFECALENMEAEARENAARENARAAFERALEISEAQDAIREKAQVALERALLANTQDAIREKAQDALERALLTHTEAQDAIREKAQDALEQALLTHTEVESTPAATSSPTRTPQSATKSKRRIIGGVVRAPPATTKSAPAIRLDLDSDSDAAQKKEPSKARDGSLSRVFNALGADFHNLDVMMPSQGFKLKQDRKPGMARCLGAVDLKAPLPGAQAQKKNKLFSHDLSPVLGGLLNTSLDVALGSGGRSALAMDLGLDCPKSSPTKQLRSSASLGALKVSQKEDWLGAHPFARPSTPSSLGFSASMDRDSADFLGGSSSGSLAWSRHMAKSATKRGLHMASVF